MTRSTNSQADAAAAAVDRHTDDYLQLLIDLVRCPTTLGQERQGQDLLYRHLRRMGLQAERWDLDLGELMAQPDFAPTDWGYGGRPNVRGLLPAVGSGGRSLVLNGHIDVVSPEPLDLWSTDPWGAAVRNGRLYGRGALDMKGGLVAALLALQAVMEVNAPLRGAVIFESVIEEECTGNGMLAARLRSGRVDGAVITEVTQQRALTATPGVVWFEVTVSGKPAYVGNAGAYVNAVEQAVALIGRLKPPMVEALNAACDHPAYADIAQPLTLSVGTIAGGDWPSNVPLRCRFTCRMSYPIGWSFAQVRSFISSHLAQAAAANPWLQEEPPRLRFPGFRALGWAIDDDAAIIQALAACHQADRGERLAQGVFLGTADGRYFDLKAGEQAIYYGPAGANMHAPDEYVELQSLLSVARVLARLIVTWCA